jgi:DNA-binding NarL/FixJ family response regulator
MAMKDEVKIVIADDHPIVRQGLRQMIEAEKNFTIVGEAGDGEDALQLIETHQPDVAVLDIDMPRIGGFDVARQLKRKKSEVGIIFLTMHSEEEIFQTAMDLGVGGYVLKDSATTDIVAGIKSIASGKPFISPALSALLLNRRRRVNKLERQKPELDSLTPTERRILKLIAEDKTSREIGEELFISHRTVHAHRANISNKLNLSGNLALVKFAITHKSVL